MPWNDADDLVVANNGQVYVAPVGTALPTGPTETLAAAFVGLGYIDEDGCSISVDPDIKEFTAWQTRQPIRREMEKQEIQAEFKLQQWNENTVVLAFGGGAVTSVGGGGYRYDFPSDDDGLDERSMVVDAIDGSTHSRFVFPRGNVTENVETQFQRSEAAMLPITFKVLEPSEGGAPGYYLTDSAAFATGS